MAIIKYTGEEALGRIADYVNKKLTFASSMPSSPETNTVVLYVGATTSSYGKGNVYEYDGHNQICINSNIDAIELTKSEYDALPQAAKMNGCIYFLTDVGTENNGREIIQGYYNTTNNKFYEDSTYTTEVVPNINLLYVNLNGNNMYRQDGTQLRYILISGNSSQEVTTTYNAEHKQLIFNL